MNEVVEVGVVGEGWNKAGKVAEKTIFLCKILFFRYNRCVDSVAYCCYGSFLPNVCVLMFFVQYLKKRTIVDSFLVATSEGSTLHRCFIQMKSNPKR